MKGEGVAGVGARGMQKWAAYGFRIGTTLKLQGNGGQDLIYIFNSNWLLRREQIGAG